MTVFTEDDTFLAGDTIAFHTTVLESATGLPIAGATVTLEISGPESITLTSDPSDATGLSETTWSTQRPNKRGQGGTATGAYLATVADVMAAGYAWDAASQEATFTIQ